MANLDSAFGLRPTKHLNGHPWNGQAMKCYSTGTSATAVFLGDPVYLQGYGCPNGCCPAVLPRGTTTSSNPTPWLGAVVGVEPSTSTSLPKLAGSTTGYLNVTADPYLLFEIQADTTAVITTASVGLNAVFIAGAGSTITYLSGYELDSGATTAPAADGTFQILIWGAVEREDNDIALVAAKWLVLNSCHHFNSFGLEAAPTTAGSIMGLMGV